MISGVYIILNTTNGKCYVGSSKNVSGRLANHKVWLSRGVHRNFHLQNAWNRYSAASFSFEVIEECSEESLEIREQHYIDVYGSMDSSKGYNRRGAERWGELSDETRTKMRLAQLGKKRDPVSPETRKKLSACQRGKKKGPHSTETRRKIGAYWKGRTRSAETRMKMSAWQIGRKMSREARRKMSEAHSDKPWSCARRDAYLRNKGERKCRQ